MDSLATVISEQPLLAGLAPASLATIRDCAREVPFATGSYLFREGSPADQFYLLRSGRIGLEMSAPGKRRITFLTIHPGEIVGLSWLVPPYQWHFDARALEPVVAVAFDARCLRGHCDADHDLGYQLMVRFMPVMLERLQAARLQLLDLYGGRA